MRISFLSLAISFLFLAFSFDAFAGSIQGHYDVKGTVPKAHSLKKVVYEEFLNFGCPHCNRLWGLSHDLRKKYEGRVEFIDVPITFRGQDDAPLRLYHVANSLGRGEEVKAVIFNASFQHNVNVFDPGIINYLARSLGLGDQYRKESSKAWVTKLIDDGKKRSEAYGVTGTPTVVLEHSMKMNIGKYGTMDAFVKELPKTLDHLLK